MCCMHRFLRLFNFYDTLMVLLQIISQRTNATVDDNNAEIINDSIAFLILSLIQTIVQLIAGIICVDCFNQAAINQITRIRIMYFASLMRQDISWYDIEKGKTNFAVRLAE